MEMHEIEPLLEASERLLSETSLSFRRSLYGQIDWNDRLICIKGPKGTGKTTLILQHIRETFGVRTDKAVYLAMDHLWFSSHAVLDVVEWLYANGYTHVFLDEIHHAAEWQRLIKTIVDFYPKLHVVYSGSSVLKLTKAKADLSRRQAVYTLRGLSFREFLLLEGVDAGEALTIDRLVRRHRDIAGDIAARVKILPLFRMFEVLESAELVSTLLGTLKKPKLKRMGVAEKVFLGDTNLMYALVPRPEIGAVRETFFANQCKSAGHEVVSPSQGDFVVDGKWVFEVGGKGKTFKQIADMPDSFVVNDDVEVGRGNKIPLWMFGFLY